jgi:hypothetical protein
MSTLKAVSKDLMKAAGNITKAAATVVVVASTELAKGSEALTGAIIATPGFVKEVALLPVTTTAAYQAQDQGITYDEARAKLVESLPANATEALREGAKAAGDALAILMKD